MPRIVDGRAAEAFGAFCADLYRPAVLWVPPQRIKFELATCQKVVLRVTIAEGFDKSDG